ncbi:hypothetical protein [Streptomyces pratensis]|uniref:hypothetical protein n=1 Tax=Streptomyces pratensis TaxID=1169025 RepID=UPI003633AC39
MRLLRFRIRRALRGMTAFGVLLGAVGACMMWAAPTVQAAAGQPVPVTAYTQRSEPGDWVGQGATSAYRAPAADIRVEGDATYATMVVETPDVSWRVEMQAPAGDTLTPGVFRNAEGAPGPSGRAPGLAVSGDGRACNIVHGQYTINQIDTDGTGAITLLDASYVQRCEDPDAPALRGTVKYRALPLSFSYASEPGEYVGQGRSQTFTGGTAVFHLDGTPDGILDYRVSGLRQNWGALVAAPAGQSLEPGRTYQADRMGDDGAATLDVSGLGGCNHSNGEFTVQKLATDDSGQITGLALTFVQHCEGAEPALRGTIHHYA